MIIRVRTRKLMKKVFAQVKKAATPKFGQNCVAKNAEIRYTPEYTEGVLLNDRNLFKRRLFANELPPILLRYAN